VSGRPIVSGNVAAADPTAPATTTPIPATTTTIPATTTTIPAKLDQSISFTSLPPSGAGTRIGNSYQAVATATSGLLVTMTVDPSSNGVCAFDESGVVTMLAAALCTLDANQPGDDTHNPAPQVQQSFL
jgi:hypothetical protein